MGPNVTHMWFIWNFFTKIVSQKQVFYVRHFCEKVRSEPPMCHIWHNRVPDLGSIRIWMPFQCPSRSNQDRIALFENWSRYWCKDSPFEALFLILDLLTKGGNYGLKSMLQP